MANNIKKKQSKKKQFPIKKHEIDNSIRFIVPMPGRSNRPNGDYQVPYKKIHAFSAYSGDYPLEDYQAQFLLDREYIID
jgi:hypothetical protein